MLIADLSNPGMHGRPELTGECPRRLAVGGSLSRGSAPEQTSSQMLAESLYLLGFELPQSASGHLREVCCRVLSRTKDVVVEDGSPGDPLLLGQIPNREKGVQHGQQWRKAVCGSISPPEIDHRANGIEGFNVMPPEARQVERIAGLEITEEDRSAPPFGCGCRSRAR